MTILNIECQLLPIQAKKPSNFLSASTPFEKNKKTRNKPAFNRPTLQGLNCVLSFLSKPIEHSYLLNKIHKMKISTTPYATHLLFSCLNQILIIIKSPAQQKTQHDSCLWQYKTIHRRTRILLDGICYQFPSCPLAAVGLVLGLHNTKIQHVRIHYMHMQKTINDCIQSLMLQNAVINWDYMTIQKNPKVVFHN